MSTPEEPRVTPGQPLWGSYDDKTAPQPAAGEGGGAAPGQSRPGQSTPGQSTPGQSTPGQSTPGQPAPGGPGQPMWPDAPAEPVMMPPPVSSGPPVHFGSGDRPDPFGSAGGGPGGQGGGPGGYSTPPGGYGAPSPDYGQPPGSYSQPQSGGPAYPDQGTSTWGGNAPQQPPPAYGAPQPGPYAQPDYGQQPPYQQPGYGQQPPYGTPPGYGQSPYASPQPARKSRVGLIIGLVAGVVVLIAGLGLFLILKGDSPSSVVDTGLTAVRDSDVTTVRKVTCAKEQSTFAKTPSSKEKAENAKLKWKIVAERITGDTAEVDVDITDSDAKTQKGTLKLVKEGGAWKICGGESRK